MLCIATCVPGNTGRLRFSSAHNPVRARRWSGRFNGGRQNPADRRRSREVRAGTQQVVQIIRVRVVAGQTIGEPRLSVVGGDMTTSMISFRSKRGSWGSGPRLLNAACSAGSAACDLVCSILFTGQWRDEFRLPQGCDLGFRRARSHRSWCGSFRPHPDVPLVVT